MKGNFRHCYGENIEVYNAEGKTQLEAVRNLVRGLRRIAKDDGIEPSIINIQVVYNDVTDTNNRYDATAYCYGKLW